MISEKMRSHYMKLMPDLLDFWLRTGRYTADQGALFLEVCKTFNKRLLEEVCPHIDHLDVTEMDDDDLVGECAIGAIEFMKDFERTAPRVDPNKDTTVSNKSLTTVEGDAVVALGTVTGDVTPLAEMLGQANGLTPKQIKMVVDKVNSQNQNKQKDCE